MKVYYKGTESKFGPTVVFDGEVDESAEMPSMWIVHVNILDFLQEPYAEEHLASGGSILFVSGEPNYCGLGLKGADILEKKYPRCRAYPLAIPSPSPATDLCFSRFISALQKLTSSEDIPWEVVLPPKFPPYLVAAYLALTAIRCLRDNPTQQQEIYNLLEKRLDLWATAMRESEVTSGKSICLKLRTNTGENVEKFVEAAWLELRTHFSRTLQ